MGAAGPGVMHPDVGIRTARITDVSRDEAALGRGPADYVSSTARMTIAGTRVPARPQWAFRWFFPAAALYGAMLVPLSLQGMLGEGPWVPALASPAAHARELLYGFVLGVVAGYLMGRTSTTRLWLALVLWFAARVAWLAMPGTPVAGTTQALFIATIALSVVPKFVGYGRKLRNLTVAPLIALLSLSAPAYDLAFAAVDVSVAVVAFATVLLLAWLMAFMGGRLIAPAVAGQLGRQGDRLDARVQPHIEGATIGVLATSALLACVPRLWMAVGALSLSGGVLVAIRLARWRFWRCRGRADLWCLCAGYGWLAVGLMLFGLALLTHRNPTAALHLITVGALGTLTINVMIRTHVQGGGGTPERETLMPLTTLLIAMATAARVTAAAAGASAVVLMIAAAAWSAAYLLVALRLLVRPGRAD